MHKNTQQIRSFTWPEYVKVTSDSYAKNGKDNHGRDTWAGGSHEQCFSMASGAGYTAAVAEAEQVAAAVEETVAAQLFATTFNASYQCAGAEVDMGRFLSGEPECMIESEPIRIAREGRAVRICVPAGFVNSVGEEVVRQRGAAVLALVDILSRAQHPLEIWAVFVPANNSMKRRIVYKIEVQSASDPVDIGKIMFALAHPGMFRRLGFCLMDTETDPKLRDNYSITHGYGLWPGGAINEIQPEDVGEDGGATIILPPLTRGVSWDHDRAVAWVTEQVQGLFA
jgi:hypothetical protein